MKIKNMSITQLESLVAEREAEKNTQNQKKILLDKLAQLDGKDGWQDKKTEAEPKQQHGLKVKPHRNLKELQKVCEEKYKK